MMPDQPVSLTPLEPGFVSALRLRAALIAMPPVIGLSVLALAFDTLPWRGPFLGALLAVILAVVLLWPPRAWRYWGYAMDSEQLRVVRGHLFETDTVVPLVRVQHIDVSRGPIERMLGLATLTIHTAGTLNNTVSLPGLAPDVAYAMRDDIRARILSDFS